MQDVLQEKLSDLSQSIERLVAEYKRQQQPQDISEKSPVTPSSELRYPLPDEELKVLRRKVQENLTSIENALGFLNSIKNE